LNPTRVFVGGEVFKPGFVTYTPGLTAVQAAMQVGGWKDTADLQEVVLLQKTSEGSSEYRPSKINLGKVVELGDTKADIILGPSDVLVFPKTDHREGQPVDAAVRDQHDPDPHLGDPVLMSAAALRRP
jgi:protein involved in polysaccharide export with SLBB domain